MKIAYGTGGIQLFTLTRIHGNISVTDHVYASIFKKSPRAKMIGLRGRARQDGKIMSMLGARKIINVGSIDLEFWITKPASRRPETTLGKDSQDVGIFPRMQDAGFVDEYMGWLELVESSREETIINRTRRQVRCKLCFMARIESFLHLPSAKLQTL